jgi:acetyl-CoA carboxylase carboxyltransferase component
MRLTTALDPRSEKYLADRAVMVAALAEVEAATQQVRAGGGDRYVERHRQRGKLLVRERVELLLDRDAPFLELSPLAGWGTEDPLGGAAVTGVGVVSGTSCVLIGYDPTVRGGTTSPTTLRKVLRAMEIARVNRLPLVHLTESGGADLPRQAEIFVPGGATFKEISRLSAAGVPTVALVFGSSTAGGAYVPGMSDYTVFVKDGAKVFLGGPPLVKMAIDEDADEEALGGAELHARTSGLADYLARDERDALRIGREILRHIRRPSVAGTGGPPPLFDPDELLGVPSADPRVPFEIREVLARVVDGSEFDEFKPLYGTTLVTGFAALHGMPVGVLANNGILFSQEAQKGAHFIQLCNQVGMPLLFVHNITGFMVGTRAERGGIIKDGAKLINAVSNSAVPHLTLMVGASYGAGNYAMSGRAYDPRFVFSWPSHRIAVMGGRQLAGVMAIVTHGAADSAAIEAQIDRESTALYATGHLWDDGLIDPRDTRTVLGIALSVAQQAPAAHGGYAVFRM